MDVTMIALIVGPKERNTMKADGDETSRCTSRERVGVEKRELIIREDGGMIYRMLRYCTWFSLAIM